MAASKKIDHADIRQTFNELDLDKNGMLDLEEFEEAMKILGLNSSEVDKAFSVTYLVRKNRKRKNYHFEIVSGIKRRYKIGCTLSK